MRAKSIKGKTVTDIRSAIDAATQDGLKPTLAIVFTSCDPELDALRNLLTGAGIAIFGASSGSEFVDGEIESGSMVVLLLDMNPDAFRIELVEAGTESTKASAERIGKFGQQSFRKPAFIIVSGGLNADGDQILEGIGNICGQGTTVFGGLAADSLEMKRTFVFTGDKLTDKGLLALVVDEEKISLTGIAVGGWKPMGMERVITKSEGNVVYTIDNEPALDFISRYAGIKNLHAETAVDFLVSSNFQLQLQRENKHPVMRTPMQANTKDHSIIFAGGLPQGSKVRLCLLPGFEVIEQSLAEFAKYKQDKPQVDALVMFSCAGRQLSLGPYVSEEITGVKNLWDAPMAGFFCYGEIGRVSSGNHEFHNMTCSLAMIREI